MQVIQHLVMALEGTLCLTNTLYHKLTNILWLALEQSQQVFIRLTSRVLFGPGLGQPQYFLSHTA